MVLWRGECYQMEQVHYLEEMVGEAKARIAGIDRYLPVWGSESCVR